MSKNEYSLGEIYNELWRRHWEEEAIYLWELIKSYVPTEVRNGSYVDNVIPDNISNHSLLIQLMKFLTIEQQSELAERVSVYRKRDKEKGFIS